MDKSFSDEQGGRIKFAYYLDSWTFEGGDRGQLENLAERVLPSTYEANMDGHIFCPVCFTNLIRAPKNKNSFSNSRKVHFKHQSSYRHVPCRLRTRSTQGKNYDSYEEAKKAIDNEKLVIINGFLESEPALDISGDREYSETAIEDKDGPVADMPISRHTGESFQLPSKIMTVQAICRNFDKNRFKYYVLPGRRLAERLVDLSHKIDEVEAVDSEPKLYWGVIKESFNAGHTSNNIRMTELVCHPKVKDFYFKDKDGVAQRRGIHDDTKNRILIVYGKVTQSGLGLCIEDVKWGEYALLPEKYNKLLEPEDSF